MKRCTCLVAGLLCLALAPAAALAQSTLYWDVNGSADGGKDEGGFGDGTWSGTDVNWNTDPTGGAAGTLSAWTNALDHAVFSAGSNVVGDPVVDVDLTVAGTQSAASVLFEEGYVKVLSGVIDTPQVTINTGAKLGVTTVTNISAAAGKITLAGGTYEMNNFGHAGSFIFAAKALEINGSGTIHYDDTVARTPTDCQCTIYTPGVGNGILGVGGTPTAGAGTLIKTGAGEVRVQGAQLANFSFEKLVIQEGLYRVGSSGTAVPEWERGFGATPPSLLTDAITLDGGEIGSSVALTLSANRGVTVTPNGGTFQNGGAGVVNFQGPLTGSGTITVTGTLLSPTSLNHGVSTGGTTLSNASNVSTFNGNVVISSSTLTLTTSLTTPNFSGGVTVTPPTGSAVPGDVTTIGTVSIAAAQTFTAGSDNNSTSYAGRVIGAGTFRKVGSGTLTLDSSQTVHAEGSTVTNYTGEWSNTGGVIIDGGTIRFGTSLAGFGTLTPVTVNNGATLDMNNINDTFGGLVSDAGNTTGQVLQGSGNLTLAAATGTRTFAGTITGSGNFNKGRALPGGAADVATQILTGNNSLGPVNVNAGSLIFNGTNTTGAVTVNGGTLGGTGSVSGAATVNSDAHVAPGSSGIGTLTLNGGLTLNAGSILDFELGAPGTSDLLNVTLSNGLNIAGATTVNLSNAGGLAVGNYTLIDYAGSLGGNFANLALGTTPSGFSYALNNTGSVITLSVTGASAPDGDYNNNGVVDAADYVLWRKNPSAFGGDPAGFNTWKTTFGQASPGAGSGGAVPEPASFAIIMLGLTAFAGFRRSR